MLVLFLALLGSPSAEPTEYVADVAHSILEFEVDALTGPVHGTFKGWAGEITVDNGDLSTLRGSITVDVATIDTRITKRDKHLRNEDFFHVEVHPKAQFTVQTVEIPKQEGAIFVNGLLSMHGVSLPLSMSFTVKHQDEKRIRLQGKTTLSRKAFGINFQSRLNPIQDDVVLQFNLNWVVKETE
jgi:polyisoprenoid-binding protein YceI